MTQADVLTAIDDALETGATTETDPVARELQELALVLRADAPEPTDEYSEWLDRRVEKGFPKPPRLKAAVVAAAPAAGPLSSPCVARARPGHLARSAGLSGSPERRLRRGVRGRERLPRRRWRPAPQVPPTSAAQRRARGRRADSADGSAASRPDGPTARSSAPSRWSSRRPSTRWQRVADQVTAVTNRHGGFVLSSSVSTGEDSSGGDFNLRIPVNEVRPALRDLAALADVRSQSQTGRDVTPAYVTARDRLRAARAERKSLLRRLEAATTDAEAEAIRRRLDIVAGQINALRGRLHGLRLRTDYAVVTVSLLAKDDGGGGGGGGSFDDALDDAGKLLVGVAGIIVRVLAVALPLGLIALLGWLAGRALQRRRRESALV